MAMGKAARSVAPAERGADPRVERAAREAPVAAAAGVTAARAAAAVVEASSADVYRADRDCDQCPRVPRRWGRR